MDASEGEDEVFDLSLASLHLADVGATHARRDSLTLM